MRKEIIISGYGGQGVLQAGNILCKAGLADGHLATFFPSYGAEMRGGSANCKVIISDDYIGSPMVYKPDYVLSFSFLAFDKFYSKLKADGLIFINSDLVKTDKTDRLLSLGANSLSEKFGTIIMANMAMLGFFVQTTAILKPELIEAAIKENFGRKGDKIVNSNINVFRAGMKEAEL